MAKQKSLTPQEIYRARKAREEREKNALLPPGLLNHGNTCFMNSVLQGLIATQHLSRLVLFQDIPPAVQLSASIPVASRRSPELTNGHGLAGHYERPWTPGLPIGDLFVTLLRQAWAMQDDRQRNYLKPKELLASVGQKYDQYLDFRQQDAHEFLRHLLDAMQMEEADIIKKRQPSIKHKKKKSSPAKAHASPKTDTHDRVHIGSPLGQIANAPDADPSPPEEETLAPFVDMLFGGKLASILVCQACKHVSHTYEDFNDLSLSIKAEDYARERKRDKLKQLAKKLRNISGTALSVIPVQRSSSVPATPHRDSTLENAEVVDPHRRRSIDLADVEVAAVVDKHSDHEINNEITVGTDLSLPQLELHFEHQLDTALHHPPESDNSPAATPDFHIDGTPEAETPHKGREHIEISEPSLGNGREKREKSESWSKLGRRISVSVGLTKQSREDRRRSKEQKKARHDASHQRNAKDDELYPPSPSLHATVPTVQPIDSPDVNAEREPTSLSAVNDLLQAQLAAVKRSWSPVQKPSASPSLSSTPRFPLIPRQPAPSITSKRSKAIRPPKLSAEEAAYLRDILADVSPGGAASPFSIFKQTKDQSSAGPSTVQNMFLKIPQLGGLEDCLRLFTSVEVLDGENMVKCHRCWKIANGLYEPRSRSQNQESDSCTDSDDENESLDDEDQPIHTRHPSGSAHHTPMPNHSDLPRLTASPSSSATSLYDTPNSHDTLRSSSGDTTFDTSNGSHSLKSLPLSLELSSDDHLPSTSTPRLATYGGLPIPMISTTAPESPMSIKTARPIAMRSPTDTSQASLHAHTSRQDREKHPANTMESEGCSDEEGGVSANLSAYSDVSSTAVSPVVSPNVSQEKLAVSPTPRAPPQYLSKIPDSTGVPPSKKVIMRAAYKRYLIATPPPVLVIHLKRFQQMSKVPIMSFSSSFKKLEDYVSFPEYLDIAPYLAPKREQYADIKPGHVRGRSKRCERCMYRLYAVVVHMGNMLGGHYIAYTALPSATKEDKQATLSVTDSESLTHTDRPHRDWAYISDTTVRLSSLDEVLKSKAYICMYERI
ncbi:peptidase C19, ubiquitin carboxyl-terminal hydrolase 2 [Suillus fuscotomentosus]|uniref:ubiquitinyl hydrolase 1 n=1 Tax=Suillus fuscotomentosus TaxID=1912939 RepID=A0AAD4EAB5_9AGAM|nr:peptidase C19, ubiquitin carboxyl-terminal hydrolase 2 [Suillus fuscotomentosus]KAG1902495.1 peptidase C19, ubiquitin carboxyl-terminal hydrolase 2 [Suillus fuscotomentosus]